MIVSVAACGESASEWYKVPHDYSIGVNDCQKWNHPVNALLLINQPKSFVPSRLETIKSTKFDKILTHSGTWDKIFPQNERIRLQSFSKHLKKGHVYSSKTSPFVAMSLAFNYGATDIILHGVDLISHPAIKDKLLNYEIRNIQAFTKLLKEQGCNVWLAKPVGALKDIIPHWNSVLGKMRQEMKENFKKYMGGIPKEEWFKLHKDAMTEVILKQAQEDFKALGYISRTGDDQEVTFNC